MGDDFDKLVGEEEIHLPLKVHPLGGYPWPIYSQLPIHIHRSPAEAGERQRIAKRISYLDKAAG
jgi:hypothetical protein